MYILKIQKLVSSCFEKGSSYTLVVTSSRCSGENLPCGAFLGWSDSFNRFSNSLQQIYLRKNLDTKRKYPPILQKNYHSFHCIRLIQLSRDPKSTGPRARVARAEPPTRGRARSSLFSETGKCTDPSARWGRAASRAGAPPHGPGSPPGQTSTGCLGKGWLKQKN